MTFNTTLTQARDTNVLKTGIFVQIDNMSVQEASNLGGAAPYDSFWIYPPNSILDVQRGDFFTDEKNSDPKTKKNAVYRVFSNPEQFELDHHEIAVEKVVGT